MKGSKDSNPETGGLIKIRFNDFDAFSLMIFLSVD
tara:strand:+ start:1059 stop:1163 length:105 start_codon:yes stop_codon:yes gene_type:complete